MYCPSCGTQNDDHHKFCKKCGTTLPTLQAKQQTVTSPKPAQSTIRTAEKASLNPADQVASYALTGAVVSMIGGAVTVIGWFMPWSKDFATSTNGLKLTITAINRIFGSFVLSELSQELAFLTMLYGIVTAIAYGIIPILGALTLKDGYAVFEKRNPSNSFGQSTLTTLQFRGRNGFILVAIIFFIPMLFSTIIGSLFPVLDFFGGLLGRLIQSETGAGIFVTAAGFAMTYVGARYAGTKISEYNVGEAEIRRADFQAAGQAKQLEQLQPEASPPLNEKEKEIVRAYIETKDDAEVSSKLNIPESILNRILLDLFHRYKVSNKDDLIIFLETKHLI